MLSPAAAFAAVFAALFAAHSFGDHWWGQTHTQALGKGATTARGRWHCAGHVLLLAAHKAAFLVLMQAVTGLHLSPVLLSAGLLVDAVSHYWADRRFTLAALAQATGKGEFYRLGTDTVTADGTPAAHLGTGAYALDQSWHIGWLFVAALIITA